MTAFLVSVLVNNTAASLGILVVVSVDFVLVVGSVWVVVVVHAPVFSVPFLDAGGAWADSRDVSVLSLEDVSFPVQGKSGNGEGRSDEGSSEGESHLLNYY